MEPKLDERIAAIIWEVLLNTNRKEAQAPRRCREAAHKVLAIIPREGAA